MNKEEYILIAGKVADGTASKSEIALYNAYYNEYQLKYPVWDHLSEPERLSMLAEVEAHIADQLRADDAPKRIWLRMAMAAAAVAAIVAGIYFLSPSRNPEPDPASQYTHHITPGKHKATLTLANGKVINLSGAKAGVVVGEDLRYNDNTVVIPKEDHTPLNNTGKRDLSLSKAEGRGQMLMASTPKGGTYQVTLPDGTKVWLNADSKLSFPSQFIGDKREISLSGEAYFEVAKGNKLKVLGGKKVLERIPFVVKTQKQEVEVLGTHFNINAYKDETNTRTTLLEGSVRVSLSRGTAGSAVVLKPNQQSVIAGKQLLVKAVDADEAIAWKNNKFIFEKDNIRTVMAMVARWYDVDVVYEGQVTDDLFGGSASRSDDMSKVLKSIELTGKVHFKIQGRRIYVTQ